MAARRAEQRTDRARRRGGAYLARGSAAVDVRPAPQREAAEPRVPQETPQPVRRVRAQVRVSPFCVIGGAVLAFLLQWGLYQASSKGVDTNDTLQLLSIVPFDQLWKPVAGVFLGAGMLIGVGGSLSAIRRFLQV